MDRGDAPTYSSGYGDPAYGQAPAPMNAVATQPGQRGPPQFVPGKVFLGGLGSELTSDQVRDYALLWGPLRDIHVMEGKGYGFLTFERVSDAQEFLGQHEHDINGKKVEAKAAIPKDQGGSRLTKKLFTGGIGDVSDETFQNHFTRYGNIVTAVVMRKHDGTSKNYGFVTFDDEMSVEKCLVEEHSLNGRKIEVRRAHPRDGGEGRDRSDRAMMGYGMGPMPGGPAMMGMPMPGMFGMMPGFPGGPGMMPMMGGPGMMPGMMPGGAGGQGMMGPGMMPGGMGQGGQGVMGGGMMPGGPQGMMPNPMFMAYGGMPMMGGMPQGGQMGGQMGSQRHGGSRDGGRPSSQGGGRSSMGGDRDRRSQDNRGPRSSQGGNQRFRPY